MKTSKLLSALLVLVLGVLFVMFRDGIIGISITVFGVLLIATAVVDLIRREITSGVIKAVMGVAVLLIGFLLIEVALMILGVVLAAYGVVDLIQALTALRKRKSALTKLFGILTPTISIFVGVLLVVVRGEILSTAVLVAGVVLIVDGTLGMVDAMMKK